MDIIREHVEEIFDALKKLNVSDEILKQVVLNTKKQEHYFALDQSVIENEEFIINCLKEGVVSISLIPQKFINTKVISREVYIKSIKQHVHGLSTNLYKLNEEEIVELLKKDLSYYAFLEIENKKNIEIIKKVLPYQFGIITKISNEMKDEIFQNEELTYSLLKQNNGFYNDLNIKQRNDIKIIKLVIKNKNGYDLVKNNLKNHDDDELALIALDNNDSARSFLHPFYQEIFNTNKVKKDYHNFLKIYLMNKDLEQEIPKKENNNIEINKKLKV